MQNDNSDTTKSVTATLSLEDRVIVALRRINRAVDLHSRGLLNQFGFTGPQLAALREIGRAKQIAVGALARLIHVSQATLTGIITRLEKQGHITRTRSDSDRRSVVVELTEKGQEALKAAPPVLHERFRKELTKLEQWEQTQMLSMLQRIASMMDAAALEGEEALDADEPAPDNGRDLRESDMHAGSRRRDNVACDSGSARI